MNKDKRISFLRRALERIATDIDLEGEQMVNIAYEALNYYPLDSKLSVEDSTGKPPESEVEKIKPLKRILNGNNPDSYYYGTCGTEVGDKINEIIDFINKPTISAKG